MTSSRCTVCVREGTGELLEDLGYEVDLAQDGAEAIALYRKALSANERYTAVIMDLTIPGGMGGRETIRRLQAIHPEVKAIVASGYSNDPVLADPVMFGFTGRLQKPFELSQLERELSRVLRS